MRPIVILDFGSQFAHLIGNRIRRVGAYSEILPVTSSAVAVKALNPAGIILSGGPQSVFAEGSPHPDPEIFSLGVPIMGICYGHQLLAHHFGGTIESGQKEFGKAEFTHHNQNLLKGVPATSIVWMNHGDSVTKLPPGFEVTGSTGDCKIAAFENVTKKIYSVQFHPEVTHTEYGMDLLKNFVVICGSAGSWNLEEVAKQLIEKLRQQAGSNNVFLLVSGGVDSSVAFALLTKALGKERVYGLFVDHGLLRKDEAQEVQEMLAEAGFTNLHLAEEETHFLQKLNGKTDPEAKRQAIGTAFLEVQAKIAKALKLDSDKWLLGQGTIYPDHIETGGTEHASKIKTHHNRVPEIEKLLKAGKIIEPLADFYKDEVREIGRQLGLSEKMVMRHPFPGPGLGVRILCQQESFPLATAAEIETEVLQKYQQKSRVLPVRSVGVQGDARSYRHPLAIYSTDPVSTLLPLATSIPNTFQDINRVIVALNEDSAPADIYPKLNAEISPDRIQLLQEADAVTRKILLENNLMEAVWQFPVILLPLGTKAGGESIILRPIRSENAMTATAVIFTEQILKQLSESILRIPGITTVFLDITSKPPGTIEWE